MKSTETYKLLNAHISKELKEKNFKRLNTGMLGYSKQINNCFLIFWFQCSRDGFDQYAGSKFTVEFSVSTSPIIGSGIARGRIPKYMNDKELAMVKEMQNEIILSLDKPPNNYFILNIKDDNIKAWYRKKFTAIEEEYTNISDIWFRYQNEMHVNIWGTYLSGIIFRILEKLEEKYLKGENL